MSPRTRSQLRLVPRTRRRAIGVIRVSEVAGRRGERFVSPVEQRQTIERACEREGLELTDVLEELDVSGGKPLAERPGMRVAVNRIEAGDAEVIVVAYFDRLVRKLRVQEEILERVEAADGSVLAVDVGEVRTDTAARWLTSTMLGMVSEYVRRNIAEKTREARHDAILRGVPPFAHIPPGYRRGTDGRLQVVPAEAAHVADAFRLRASGASLTTVRRYLHDHGIERTYRSTQTLLKSKLVLGELHCDELQNLHAHEPIVDREVWQRVQRVKGIGGRRTKSARLLARLGVLRCSGCGRPLSAGTVRKQAHAEPYPIYRCSASHAGDCPQPVIIGAEIAERLVINHVRARLEGIEEPASVESKTAEAEKQLAERQAMFDNAVQAFAGLEEAASVNKRLQSLQAAVHEAEDEVQRLRAATTPSLVASVGNWDELIMDEQRALIVAIAPQSGWPVLPGRGRERIAFEPLGQ